MISSVNHPGMCISRLWDWDLWIEDQPVHSPLSIGRTVHLLREYCPLRGVEVSEGCGGE